MRREQGAIERLVTHCIEHYFPQLSQENAPALVLLEEVTRRSARLVASYFVAGFVHGVLKSDNHTVTAESFDYGPYRFLPQFDPDFTAAYFDEVGLYAFSRQPRAIFRNLERLATCLERQT